tara:strand:- start:2029 stop:2241 length:213 start_codon:yes stop_codon:yes gene_type:complete
MRWNYRVLSEDFFGEPYLRIHEVYYNKKNEGVASTLKAATVEGDNIEELRDTLNKMLEALDKKILIAKDI